jgi:hypothetical protein
VFAWFIASLSKTPRKQRLFYLRPSRANINGVAWPNTEMKMRKLLTPTLVVLSLAGSLTAVSAQTYESPVRQQESSQPSIPSGPTDRGYLAE